MLLRGKVWKQGKYWLIHCPALDATTQGHSKDDAVKMLKDWIRTALDAPRFHIESTIETDGGVFLTFENPNPILELALERARYATKMTYEDLAKKLSRKSRSSAKTALSMKHDPRLSKLVEIARALGYNLEISLVKRAG